MKIHPENNQLARYKILINKYLSKEEIKAFHQKSNLLGAWEVLQVWLWIVGAFALVAWKFNIITIIIALFILGGKQLAAAIILHDCSHYSLFKSKKLNVWIGNIFGAYPVFQNIGQYRPYHLQHHVATGTSQDPDINLTKGYPTTKAGMIRKTLRDLIGLTGIKAFFGVILMHIGLIKYNLGNQIEWVPKEERSWGILIKNTIYNLSGPIIFHLLFFSIFWISGKPWLYSLWWISYFTTQNFVLRIRSMAEHSMVEDRNNPMQNTRTTYANFFERILFAPLHVNYHAEHHLLIAAPCYQYPKLHKLLKDRGFYKEGLIANNYFEIVKMAVKDF